MSIRGEVMYGRNGSLNKDQESFGNVQMSTNYPTKAYCSSGTCSGRSGAYKKILKPHAKRNDDNCPDCGCQLFWGR